MRGGRRATPSFRLPADVRPAEYDVHLEPDLTSGRFAGRVRIAVDLARPRATVTLHALDLEITDAVVVLGGRALVPRVVPRPREQTLTLKLPQAISGRATLALGFSGVLGRQLRGLYAVEAEGRRYAFTQLEAADARRVFPCFDEPSFKARFRIAVTITGEDAVLSNAPVESEERAGDKRTVRFALTPPLSTYLLAVAVGPLEPSAVRSLGSTPIRVWHAPGKAHLTAFGLEAAAETLRRLEEYFAIPYPYGKLDLVAVPDFEAGAMENAGAVFFRETLLLLDPSTVSLQETKRAAEVIAHELAHMWYGDLVTMEWWDDLWLNEAFATWMAYRVVDDWRPEWRVWQSFEHDRAGALALDALSNTHPIYARVDDVAQATENFDVITYEKGAAVVRMIEHYLGPEIFREGVRRYVERHREGNAVAADLWSALEEASGRAVARVAETWIRRPGFPLVDLEAAGRGCARLRVRQRRFFADPRVPAARRRGRWPIPLVVKWGGDGEPAFRRFLVDGASGRVELDSERTPRWYFGNAGAGGFYRVRHDPKTTEALLAELPVALTAVERLALVGDQWALVRSGGSTVESFLGVPNALADEPDADVLDGVAGPLAVLDDQVVDPGSLSQAALRSWIAEVFGPAFRAAGWSAGPEETDAERLRRSSLLRLVGLIAEERSVVEAARERLEAYLADRSALEPNLADPVVSLAARTGDEALYERYRGVVERARTPQERRRFLLSLASFRDLGCIRRTLEGILAGDVPTQDVAFLLMRLFSNPAARETTWVFLVRHWAELRERVPPLMVSRLIESTPALREPRYAREVARFFRAHPVPEAARALKQALELFRLNAELRRGAGRRLAGWLAARGQRLRSPA